MSESLNTSTYWKEFCGPGGMSLWNNEYKDLSLCFQQIAFKIPALVLIAILSSYYNGKHHTMKKINIRIVWPLTIRASATILSAFIPIIHICVLTSLTTGFLRVVDYMQAAIEAVAWLIHFSYIQNFQYNLNIPFKGPMKLGVIWTWHFVSTLLMLRSLIIQTQKDLYPQITFFIQLSRDFTIFSLLLQIIYLFSLFISDKRTLIHCELRNTAHESFENEPLLGTQVASYNRFHEETDPYNLGMAMENSNIFSRLIFYWVNPIIEKGSKLKIHSFDDLFDMPLFLNTRSLSTKLDSTIAKPFIEEAEPEIDFIQEKSLLKSLHKNFGWQFYSIGILKFIADSLGLLTPVLLNYLIKFLIDKKEPLVNGYLYASGLTLCTLIAAFCTTHFNFLMSQVGLKIRASLISIIYKKALTLKSTTVNSFSVGEILNFMNNDTDRIINSCPSFHTFWSIPFQLFMSLYLLYKQIGISFLAGVIFTIILIPINKYVASKIGELSTKLMFHKDNRVKLITEVLRGIRTIKYNLWEKFFINKIKEPRENELKYLKGRKYLDALCVYFWATTPIIISILNFVTYVLLGNELDAAVVFTCIALMNMLIAPLNAFPWVLNGLTEAWVSMKRIQRFLDASSFRYNDYYDPLTSSSSLSLQIKKASFSWNLNESNNVLSRINLNVPKGLFIGIMGQVGSGKSSFLNAILGEIEKREGHIELEDLDKGFGFVSQNPWIQRGTIRDNILMGKLLDPIRFRKVLSVCALSDEVASMPGGPLAQIGHAGSTLSGGQKSRLALARAVYHDKPIYLLDDVFSALDHSVANWILDQCIHKFLIGKTRILCTHQSEYLAEADLVIILNEGQIISQGPPENILKDFEKFQSQEYKKQNDTSQEQMNEPFKPLLVEEVSEVGSIQKKILYIYWRAIGTFLAISILLSLLLMQASRNFTDLWLTFWVSNTSNNTDELEIEFLKPQNDTTFYLTVYGILAGCNSLFTLMRAFLFAYGGVKAANNMHKKLLKSVIDTTVSFFDTMPLGGILNRFSSDTYTVDDSLPFILNILLAQLFSLIGVLLVTIYGQPWLVIVLIPLIPIYHWLQFNYRLTARELRRLVAVTLTPLYSLIEESLSGLVYIRSFRVQFSFIQRLENLLDASQRAQFSSAAVSQWLGLRLLFISVILVGVISHVACVQHQYDYANPGLIGLALTYALTLTSTLNGVVNAFTETEREMIAVERISQYYELPPEEVHNSNGKCKSTSFSSQKLIPPPPYGWPALGVINFINVTLKYQVDLDPALHRVSFQTRPAERIGVVGRTGSGKSSLLAALMRVTPELEQGVILIDNINISEVSLETLRSQIAIIPQEPFLFAGTIRENLKPCIPGVLNQINDAELWNILQKTHLDHFVHSIGGLDGSVITSGNNFSAGQKQLLCLARALLQNAKIVCLDEATANLDQESDKHIQQILRSHFRCSTVITVAHRIETILEYDRILVMENGKVKHFDSPSVLGIESLSRNFRTN